MVHHSQPRDSAPGRTRIGMEPVGRVEATTTATGSAASQAAVPVGASGNLFEIPDAPGGRALVIKIFPWGSGLPVEVVQNFTDEARRVASLHHPHVVPVIDAGCLGDGTPFVVVDRLRGQTLEERIAQRGTPPPAELVAILRAVASALSVAHAMGVVHREIRADNIFIDETSGHPGGVPRLLDFGVAHLGVAARAAGRVVREAPADEVAPEVRAERGAGGDHRADQLALAALAHRLLRGAVAW